MMSESETPVMELPKAAADIARRAKEAMDSSAHEESMGSKASRQSLKLRLDLIPVELQIEVAKVLTYGAIKYEPDNWRKGIRYSEVFGALSRHLLAWWSGEEFDQESTLHHLSHAATELAFLIAFESSKSDREKLDDRWRTK